MGFKANERGYRFLLLFFNCMLTFGSYFCFDMPSVLQTIFTGTKTNCSTPVTNNSDPNTTTTISPATNCTPCDDCLEMSDDNYNLLYAIYAWTNAVVVIGAGFLIDKLGNRFGVFLFSFLCVVGSSTFAVGAMLEGTSAMLPVMLLGRLIFGSGNGSLTIVQNRITAYWFRNKELALAFGITLAFSRLGSVLNFFLTENIESHFGLIWTLWGGAMLCGLGFISAIIVSFLDIYGVKQLGDSDTLRIESKKVRVTDIRYFSSSYWLLAFSIMFFYNGVFPFVADSSKYIQKKYNYDVHDRTPAYISGAVYDVSMVLSPFLGGLIDVIGKRGILAMGCALFTIPVFGLLAFTHVYPLIPTLWLGITYSVAAASLWPSIPLVVSQATIGTAMGLTTSIQMIGIGLSNLAVGSLLGDETKLSNDETLKRWKLVMIFLLGNTIMCVVSTLLLNVADKKKDGTLNLSKKQKLQARDILSGSGREDQDSESSDDEREPLIGNKRSAIN